MMITRSISLKKNYVISFSYFYYKYRFGGTDKFISEQKEFYRQKGYSYVFVYPTKFITNRINLKTNNIWSVIIDDRYVGVFSNKKLINFFLELNNAGVLHEIIINHVMNVPIEALSSILSFLQVDISFYFHDYYLVCPVRGLIRRNGAYCGKTKIEKKCISECMISHSLIDYSKEISSFIHNFSDRLYCYFPSECAKSILDRAYNFSKCHTTILPHYLIKDFAKYLPEQKSFQKIKVAYVGSDLDHKGYSYWKNFIDKINKSKHCYLFYHFGNCKQRIPGVEYVDVNYSLSTMNMTSLLKKYNIDCVVLWSIVPETFSYTYFEAYSADTFIVTNSKSGNIASQVKIHKNGYVCESEDDLYLFFFNYEKVKELVYFYFNNVRNIPKSYIENRKFIPFFENNLIQCDLNVTIGDCIFSFLYQMVESLFIILKKSISYFK